MWSQKRQEEFTNYKDFIGMDITSLVSLPVWIMEPFTMLQKMAEIMEYNDRLEKALECDDPYIRQVALLFKFLALVNRAHVHVPLLPSCSHFIGWRLNSIFNAAWCISSMIPAVHN